MAPPSALLLPPCTTRSRPRRRVAFALGDGLRTKPRSGHELRASPPPGAPRLREPRTNQAKLSRSPRSPLPRQPVPRLALRLSHAAQISQLCGHRRTHARSRDRKSTRLNSSHGYISYAVFCLKTKNI